jgi:hypothetical protein
MGLEKMARCLFLSIFSSKEQGFLLVGAWCGLLGSNRVGWCDNLLMAERHKRRKRKPEPSDAEVRDILVNALADVGADPALVYAFQKTGVYVCDENEKRLPEEKLKAFDGAVDEYFDALKRPPQ